MIDAARLTGAVSATPTSEEAGEIVAGSGTEDTTLILENPEFDMTSYGQLETHAVHRRDNRWQSMQE